MLSSIMGLIEWLLGWPLIIYAIGTSILFTIALRFVQIRYFIASWRSVLSPSKKSDEGRDMSPLQAFVNTLSTNLGNGSVVGSSVAVFMGGPGAALWVLLVGIALMSVRFAEVYLSTSYGIRAPKGTILGGPMLYLQDVVGGKILSWLYAFLCLIFGLVVGNAMQTHSIGWSIETTWGISEFTVAVCFAAFIGYVVFGGARRIVAVSDRIVPVKVAVFFGAAFIIIAYHVGNLHTALQLIWTSAFSPTAAIGGLAGFSVMQAIQSGMNLSVTATESGLGTAAILFGYTGNQDPMKSGLMGMVSTLISSFVCFLVSLCVVISGVWSSGLTSSALTIAAFNTVFGQWGGWILSFLSISFGVGVLVSYAYITRAAWLCVTNGRYEAFFSFLYCAAAFLGAVINVSIVWKSVQIINGLLLTINLFGLLFLMPRLVSKVHRSMREMV